MRRQATDINAYMTAQLNNASYRESYKHDFKVGDNFSYENNNYEILEILDLKSSFNNNDTVIYLTISPEDFMNLVELEIKLVNGEIVNVEES